MSDNPLSSKVSIDTVNFKAGITELNRQIRVIESGFKAAAAGMGDWDQSGAGLELRVKSLTDSIGLQQQKVDGLGKVYQELASGGKTSARELEELQIKLNRETETLNKMQSELNKSKTALDGMGKEAADAGGQVETLGKKEETTTSKTISLKGVLGGLGTALKGTVTAVAGLATAVAGIGMAITGLVIKTARSADELTVMSDQTGIGVERLQELSYIGDQVGTDLDTMTGSMAKLVRAMASGDTGPAAEAFAALGISVRDSSGNLRDSQSVWSEALAALGGVSNETERDALAMELFGKSAQDLNPLIKTGTSELTRLASEARKVGAVMSTESVEGMAGFSDQLDSLKGGLQGTLGTLAGAFLPGFTNLAGTFQGLMSEFAGIVQSGGGDLGKIAAGLGGLIGKVVAGLASKLPELLQAGLGILKGIISAITTNLPLLLPAVIEILKSLVGFLVTNLPILIQAGIDLVLALINGILPQLPGLVTVAIQMITTLINGIASALPQLLNLVAQMIPQIIIALLAALPALIQAAVLIIVALITGLSGALPQLIKYVPEIIVAIASALVNSLRLIAETAIDLIKTYVNGISQAVNGTNLISGSAKEILQKIVDSVSGFMSMIWDVGKSIVEGVWAGIQGAATWFSNQVTGFFKGIIDTVKRALGISSPSKVFAGIGENMAAGLGIGFAAQLDSIKNQINGASLEVGGLFSASGRGEYSSNLVGPARQTGAISVSITNYVTGGDPDKIGRATELGVKRALRARGAA